MTPFRPAAALRGRRAGAALCAVAVLGGLTACGGDDDGGAGALDPVTPTATATVTTAPPTSSPTPSATPSATSAPLSRFEADPGVRVLRAYLRASATALNAKNAKLPAYVASTTAQLRSDFPRLLRLNQGYLPGPTPITPLAVLDRSTSTKVIRGCILNAGWTLDRKGGTPLRARKVVATEVTVLRQSGTWRVDSFLDTDRISCTGVRPVEVRF